VVSSTTAMILIPLFVLLAISAWIELRTGLIVDKLTIPGAALGLCLHFLAPGGSLGSSLAGAVVGWLSLAVVALGAERYYGEEALGQGAWKLALMIGAYLGPKGVLVAAVCAFAIGACVATVLILLVRSGRRLNLPFGLCLAAGTVATVVLHANTDLALVGWTAA
jgi:prepilin signal peptidase PulO-like enzyme (type II secretory pathway)